MQQEIETHPFYTQFRAKHGLRWVAWMEISPDPKFRVFVSVQRSNKREPFTDPELTVLTRLSRHAEQSLRLGLRLLDAELASLSLSDALTRLGVGVFFLDMSGCVALANPAGRRLLGDGLDIVGDRLLATFAEDRRVLDSAIAALRADDIAGDPRAILVRRRQSERGLALFVLPVRIPAERVAERFLARLRAVVVAIDPHAGEPADPALVRDLLGVTWGRRGSQP